VQTVALRLICEREEEIRKFVPQEYWTVEADLEKDGPGVQARLHKLDGKKPEIKDEATARAIVADALKIPSGHHGREGRAAARGPAAVPHQHAAAGSSEAAGLLRGGHDADRAAAVRGHRGRR